MVTCISLKCSFGYNHRVYIKEGQSRKVQLVQHFSNVQQEVTVCRRLGSTCPQYLSDEAHLTFLAYDIVICF